MSTSATRYLRLGAVLTGVGGPGQTQRWRDPEIPGNASIDIAWYIEQAKRAEQAKLDLVFIVDSQFITADSPPHYLNRLEPLTLLSALAVSTSHVGLVGTLTTSYNDPFSIARRLGSLDLISGGRAGWNVVTSGDAGTAGNFSLDEHYDYDTRYARALEFVRVVQGLWDSYEDDAFPRNRETGQFLDPSKLHALNHLGEFFSVTGPLNLSRSAQGQPVIFQAGDSEQGRDLGGQIAEGVFTHAGSMEQAQTFRADLLNRAVRFGRDADNVLIMPGISVYIGDTDDDARAIERELQLADSGFEAALAELGRPFGWHDFRQYDLDAPFPQETLVFAERSFKTNATKIAELARTKGLTLRQTVEAVSSPRRTPFAGSPTTVANELQRWFEAGAVDGFLLHLGHPEQVHRLYHEVLPILRERGVTRLDYDGSTLRDNLGLPFVPNRHAVERERSAAPVPA